MKKKPMASYKKSTGKKEYVGLMASEGDNRERLILKYGCNIFEGPTQSNPLSFWHDSNIWSYIKENNIEYSKIYDMGVKRTGCMFCMFGVHLEGEPNRFQQMKYTHPKLWEYCIHQCGVGKVLDYIGINYGNMDLRDFIT